MSSEQDCRTLFNKGKAGKTIEVNRETYQSLTQYHALSAEIEERESQISQIKQTIMNLMQDAEVLNFEGHPLATWKTPKPTTRLDTKRLENEQPELFAQYQYTSPSSRRLLIKDLPNIERFNTLTIPQ